MNRLEELRAVVKEKNAFNINNMVEEEILEFDEVLNKYKGEWFTVKEDLTTYTKDDVKKLEDILQEVADVDVVISQLEGPFSVNLRDQLTNHFSPERAMELEQWYYTLQERFTDYVQAVILYKLERTIFRNRFNYYGG